MRMDTSPRSRFSLSGAALEIGASLIPRLGLGFVLIWFGVGELVSPGQWTGYVPAFLHAVPLVPLILVHGYILFVVGCLIAAGMYTRWAAAIGTLIILSIAATLLLSPGGTALAVRDIGLTTLGLGIALAPRHRLALDQLAEGEQPIPILRRIRTRVR